MNCFHSSLNSMAFYKAFISRSTCMFMVIMGPYQPIPTVAYRILEY